MNQRIGIIDIGSNSIRYMEAEYRAGEIHSLYKIVRSTKLAEGQDDSKCLQPCAMKRSADAVLFFAEKAKLSQVPVYAYATSAVREASNKEEFLSMISKDDP